MPYNEDDNGRFTTIDASILASFSQEQNIWYETEEDIENGIRWGKRKAWLLRRVKETMKARLTPRQHKCVTLYFFKGMTYQEIADATSTDPSSVCRAVNRGLHVLQWAMKKRTHKFGDYAGSE